MASTLAESAVLIARGLAPLTRLLGGSDEDVRFLSRSLGWELPFVPPSLRALSLPGVALSRAVARFDAARRGLRPGSSLAGLDEAAALVLADLALLVVAIESLRDRLRAELPAEYLAATSIDVQFRTRLFDNALATHLERQYADAYLIARLLGLIEVTRLPSAPTSFQPPFTRRLLRWDRAQFAITDPGRLLRDVYGWGTPDLKTHALFETSPSRGSAQLATPFRPAG